LLTIPTPSPSVGADDDLAARLLQLARRYPELSPDDQTVVRHLVGTWVKDDCAGRHVRLRVNRPSLRGG
jgi:hypothetical protein